ncbi:conditioned medium-induced protein 4 [Halobacteriales archaeon QS_1_68_17]|nr:MAG: conditioned medium-induced protein 4 [Halobacteriales archaeon QS_1_68_17]
MDEKTEQLRDIFMDVTDEETVTETQEDDRGSLTDRERRDVDEQLESVIAKMRERYAFETGLSDGALCRVVRGFYRGDDDAEIAASLVAEGTVAEAADALETDREIVERYRRVVEARAATRAVSDRFRTEFEDVLTDAGLSTRLTESVQEDGLEEATEDMETDVSF